MRRVWYGWGELDGDRRYPGSSTIRDMSIPGFRGPATILCLINVIIFFLLVFQSLPLLYPADEWTDSLDQVIYLLNLNMVSLWANPCLILSSEELKPSVSISNRLEQMMEILHTYVGMKDQSLGPVVNLCTSRVPPALLRELWAISSGVGAAFTSTPPAVNSALISSSLFILAMAFPHPLQLPDSCVSAL